jgi:hypothetical protein
MALFAAQAVARLAPADTTAFVFRVLASCLDIRAVWSLDHDPDEIAAVPAKCRLLVFADAGALKRLRRSENLHDASVELLVVIDGDTFESAWGPAKVSGSLGRWAWRQTSSSEAFYDESRWSLRGGDTGGVVRVRRKACLLWQQE